MSKKRTLFLILISLEIAVLISLGIALVPRESTRRHISVDARRFGYTPARINVNKGDIIILRFSSSDVTHGFQLDGYPIELIARKGVTFQKDIWKEFSENPEEGFKIPIWEENFTREELYEMIVKFYKSFYLRPSYILRRSFKVKSKDEFIKKARAGLSVLFMKKDKIDTLK